MSSARKFRNIAIIAHVDHGKTTLVDALLKQSGTFRENEDVGTTIMDSNDQERERGITIYAKNTAVMYKDVKINIVDTPGHADFGSEVERVLRMVDSVCLVVDAYEGPMPQTKFVLKKALELGIKPIVVINKIDKPTAQPEAVVDMLFDLFVQLGATDEQLDITDWRIVYAIAREGIAIKHLTDPRENINPLFDTILEEVAESANDVTKPFKMQIANLAYDNYVGRMGIGRVYEGKAKVGQSVTIVGNDGTRRSGKSSKTLHFSRTQKNRNWWSRSRWYHHDRGYPRYLRRRDSIDWCQHWSYASDYRRWANPQDGIHGKWFSICG
jgi:GTP-binding protein